MKVFRTFNDKPLQKPAFISGCEQSEKKLQGFGLTNDQIRDLASNMDCNHGGVPDGFLVKNIYKSPSELGHVYLDNIMAPDEHVLATIDFVSLGMHVASSGKYIELFDGSIVQWDISER